MVAHLKFLIAKLKRERFGPSSEQQRRLLDRLELQRANCLSFTAAAPGGWMHNYGDSGYYFGKAKPYYTT